MLTRRHVLGAAATLLATGGATDARSTDPEAWLGETPYLDLSDPQIGRHAETARAGGRGDRDTALALFALVRDEVRFGFTRGFWDVPASEVLRQGRGYCNTKSTLFVALLRRAGIPARQVFVDIDAAVLRGILDPGTPFVDHSYTQVFLEGAWRATDAYIVDRPLFERSVEKVRGEGRLLGYAVHAAGTCDWDGRLPAFAQYAVTDPSPIGSRTYGLFADVGDFYARADRPWNALNPVLRAGFGFLARGANTRADSLRASADP